jgi:hypothetical protein
VAAEVAERAHDVVAHDEDRLIADVRRDVRPALGQVGDVAGKLPGALEDPPLLLLDDGRVEVQTRLQGAAGLRPAIRGGGGGFNVA